MIRDLNQIENASRLECDVCIVGTGAAGLAIANELAGSGTRVVILEGGGVEQEAEAQRLYECDITGLPFFGHLQGRFRVLGGSTTRWGGQAYPLSDYDFLPRDWVPNSGWPISFDTLTPYYKRAARFMCIDDLNYDTDLFPRLHAIPPTIDPAIAAYHFTKWAPEPDLRRVYRGILNAAVNITTIVHANLMRIVLGETLRAVTELEVRSHAGRHVTIAPRIVVLCIGGIETARILLANDAQVPAGIGNHAGLVGRYFQDHAAAPIGTIESDSPAQVQKLFNLFLWKGWKYSVRLSSPPAFQKLHRILNISQTVQFLPGENSGYQALHEAYQLLRRGRIGPGFFARVARGGISAPQVLFHRYGRRRTVTPGARFVVNLIGEQEPNLDSRITLSSQIDALGMRRADLHWAMTDLSGHTFRTFGRALRAQYTKAGIGDLKLQDWVTADGDEWRNELRDQAHHMGTARMSRTPDAGVVTTDCQVHGVENLYIGGSAVFPTSGHSNPTLTLIALAIRIADDVKKRLVR